MEHIRQSKPVVLAGLSDARWRRAAAAIAALAFASAVSGCIFSPREPDGPPDEGTEIPWVTPTDTGKVLTNLAAALAGEGISNYTDCFTEDFRFHVDPSDSLDAGQEGDDRYANWTISDEETYIGGVFLESQEGIDVTFTPVDDPNEEQDDTYRRDDYELTIVWKSGDHQPGESVTYRGRVTFWMRRDETQLWSIYRWVDRRLSDQGPSDTWGILRGDYRE